MRFPCAPVLMLALLWVAQFANAAAGPAPAGQTATLNLVRYDMPLGFQDQNNDHGRTRQNAVRVSGLDAVDWPALTLVHGDGTTEPLFAGGSQMAHTFPLRDGAEARPLFQQPSDDVIQPGGHWVRAVKWLWGQNYLYTTDPTARTWMADYELWTFPVKVSGVGPADVRGVTLTWEGKTIYRQPTGALHSLTLLLPQNQPGHPYQISINGSSPTVFDVGLKPVRVNDPREETLRVSLNISLIRVVSLTRPETFPNRKEWDDDVAALGHPLPTSPKPLPPSTALAHHLGLDVPRSPETVNMVNLPHGMAGGGFFNNDYADDAKAFHDVGSAADFAAFLAGTGYDRDFERVGTNGMENSGLYDLVGAMAAKGLRLGLIPGTDWGRPFLAQPNLALYSATLPDYHAPLFRNIQLDIQRLDRFGNLSGISLGADNAGYVSYWDWAPPIPNRPWGEAFTVLQGGKPTPVPLAPTLTPSADWETTGTAKAFLDYAARYNATFLQYGYFARAVTEADASLMATTGSFGSGPGVGAGGGWPWATVPERDIFAGMLVQQAYDWNENQSSLPMHEEALLDRLTSEYPAKETWALIDDFKFLFGREPMQRAYALALTRGVQAVGTNFLPNPTGPKARPEVVSAQKELYAWVHKYGGAYALTQPTPSLGILFVYPQALMRPVDQGGQGTVEGRPRGGHEGKVTEALFLAHAAGWPAKVVTADELRRGLPPSVSALLLVGLNRVDDTWHWYDGLTPSLQAFVARGGRILTDDESVVPPSLPATRTGMTVRSYVAERDRDWTPDLLARNQENIGKLQAAMHGIPPPLAVTGSDTVWAIPTLAGDTQYLTVVNQATPPGQNVSQVVLPQTGHLTWDTNRPIYDVRRGRLLTPDEAATVDLTHDAFQYYALPPREVTRPNIAVKPDAWGVYEATVTMGARGDMTGIPVQLTVRGAAGDTATVYSATGLTVRVPLALTDRPGLYAIEVTELLSGLTQTVTVQIPKPPKPKPVVSTVTYDRSDLIGQFGGRRGRPLTIALTRDQASDAAVLGLVERLAAFYRAKGRRVTLGSAEPNGVVLSLQPFVTTNAFPRWKTVETDLILLGSPHRNVLLFDQARAGLLPRDVETLKPGHAAVNCTLSPFVGEYDSLNIVAPDTAGLRAAVTKLMTDFR